VKKFLTKTQALNSRNYQGSCQILCYYKNTTSQIQIARILNITNWYFERVVFPGEQLLFEAVPEAELEIHTGKAVDRISADKIICDRLQVQG
jgi:3-hydroxymyristoyl/3-hydroxydecanoyl-(acyl carrier protein) dehydratase